MSTSDSTANRDFIRDIVTADLASNKHGGRVVTRFPPEPNGFLHIGHAKSICLNFGLAAEHQGTCHLRFDDTNPTQEDPRFVDAIQEDVRWLGFDWGKNLFHASDYFPRLYELAVQLVEKGKAYVCSLSEDEIREYRGTVTSPGRESPYRNRSVAENLDLLDRMKGGEFPDGAHVLRARIDMASPNMKMRDPLMYRIRHASHHRTGSTWKIYPMYDWAHGQSDAIEGITHSICTLEFENNRELYDWFLDHLDLPARPQQIEFARLNLSHTVMSKRKLAALIDAGHVAGWDDPRLATIAGLRRRGYTPEAIRDFCQRIGLARRDSVVAHAQLEFSARDHLNRITHRVMAVLDPLKVIIENYPAGTVEQIEAVNNPEDESAGTRMLPFSRVLYIEQEDFLESPPKRYHRLGPGREVRLKHAYFITCQRVVKDPETGRPIELHCTYDPESRGGSTPDGRSPKGTIHWVSAEQSVVAEVRLYGHLFDVAEPEEIDRDVTAHLHPESLVVVRNCRVEPSLGAAVPGSKFQFLRHGYFCVDPDPGLVFNRTVTLRDSWARIAGQGA